MRIFLNCSLHFFRSLIITQINSLPTETVGSVEETDKHININKGLKNQTHDRKRNKGQGHALQLQPEIWGIRNCKRAGRKRGLQKGTETSVLGA